MDEAGERTILEGIYRGRGFTDDEARAIVATLFATPERALDSMMRDEVGLDPRAIGGPWAAAVSSFIASVSGAILPLLPFLLLGGTPAFVGSVVLSLAALFLLGLGVSLLTKQPPIRCGLAAARARWHRRAGHVPHRPDDRHRHLSWTRWMVGSSLVTSR